MTIGINTSPLAGREGDKVTARLIETRLAAELVGNVSLRVSRRAARQLGGAGPRRAAARGADREDAARGIRADRGQAPRGDAGDRRRCTSRWSASRSTCPRSTSASSRSSCAAQGPHGGDRQPRHRLGAHRRPRARARPDRLPHRVPDRDARHGSSTTSSRASSPGTASSAHGRPAAWSPTAPAGRPRSRCSTCRSAARSSSARAPTSTRA